MFPSSVTSSGRDNLSFAFDCSMADKVKKSSQSFSNSSSGISDGRPRVSGGRPALPSLTASQICLPLRVWIPKRELNLEDTSSADLKSE